MKKFINPQTIIIAIMFVFSAIVFKDLPDQVVTHFDSNGTPDGWMSRTVGTFFLPVLSIILYLLMKYMPTIDPKKKNFNRFSKSYQMFLSVFFIFMLVLHIITVGYNLGWDVNIALSIQLLMGILFLYLGNEMPRFKQNYFLGIRTPWTLSNEEVWNRTHRVGGYGFIAAGVCFIGSIFLPTNVGMIVPLIVLFAVAIFTMVYSYSVYKTIVKD
ncbi:MAG: SdpI family protein [Bacilli bacterium]